MRATLTALACLLAMPVHAGSDIVIEDRPCCEEQREIASHSPEAEVIASIPEQAFRSGSVLWLKLEGNRSARMIDCIAYACYVDSSRRHELVAWWPKHRQYVIDVGLYEGRQAFLISERDGRRTSVFAPPVLSPSGRYAVAADLSPGHGNGLQIIDMDTNPPTVLAVKSMPACPGAKPQLWLRPDPRWLDDTRIIFEGSLDPILFDPDVKHILRIVDGKPEWEC
ncbi:MAG: hypothetical protein EPO41_27890 [Reyranella sp.]|uniref:hypothetical protein n=1 Tax=Reyranella sp. TaxID=1929291 RepID=UPI001205859C|nr:hypothetical protein [Reyranella sp.]TAJ85181.1 MAG: hypothetical protein EPO41_27890 [Reyranella sp.]